MRLSVIVPTYNERDDLIGFLDALQDETEDVETIVVNGPSTDGTSGMVRSREDVDVLLDCASRNLNVARNAGLMEATGDAFALLAPAYRVQPGWYEAVVESLNGRADLVTGPVEHDEEDTHTHEAVTPGEIRVIGGNLAMTREAVTALDGFDEYLTTEGARDVGQRTAGQSLHVTWHPEMRVRRSVPAPDHRRQYRGGYGMAWKGAETPDWEGRYRSMAYRAIKNDGPRVRVCFRILGAALRDAYASARDVLHGNGTPSRWIGNGVAVGRGSIRGCKDGYQARSRDGTPARNPHGISQQRDEEVVVNRYVEDQG